MILSREHADLLDEILVHLAGGIASGDIITDQFDDGELQLMRANLALDPPELDDYWPAEMGAEAWYYGKEIRRNTADQRQIDRAYEFAELAVTLNPGFHGTYE